MSEVATKADIAEVMTAFEAFKTVVDARDAEYKAKGAADPLLNEQIGKIETTLSGFETANQKLTQELQQAKLKTEAALDALEVKLNRPGQHGDGRELSKKERKARTMTRADDWARGVDAALKTSFRDITDDQRKAIDEAKEQYKALNITDDTGGGYLAPVDFVAEILKTVVLISPVRALARIRTTALKSVHIPKRTALLSATWEGELDTTPPATGLKYGMLEVFNYGLRAIVDITNDQLEDAAFDMAAEIEAEVSEQFAVAEGAAFVSGNGVGKPEGFLTNAATIAAGNVTKTGDATHLTPDSVIAAFHNLKTAYARNAVWVANRQTIGTLRQLKDSVGQYLFMMGLPNGAPNTVLGAPYVEVPDMPAVGAGGYPLAIGDFNRGYSLIDRISMVMLRDPYTQAPSNMVRYLFRKRLGGQVTMPEAIQPVLVSA
ncbi:MAG: phage major capsid protein [Caulobacteraceae bacterium]|nr:phage major capsid protein [Caulobacteraceae bacterium]